MGNSTVGGAGIPLVIRRSTEQVNHSDLLGEQLLRQAEKHGARLESSCAFYEQFLANGVEHPGEVVYGTIGTGFGLSGSATLDFGFFLLPGFLTASATVGVGGSGGTASGLIVIRQPGVTHKQPRPVCFLAARGTLFEVSVKAGAAFGVTAEFSLSAAGTQRKTSSETAAETKKRAKSEDESFEARHGSLIGKTATSLSFKVGAKALVEGGVACTWDGMTLRDPTPTWFASSRDDGLIKAFSAFVTPDGSEVGLNERVGRLFFDEEEGLLAKCYPDIGIGQSILRTLTGREAVTTDELEKGLRQALLLLNFGRMAVAYPKYDDRLNAALEELKKVTNWHSWFWSSENEEQEARAAASAFLSLMAVAEPEGRVTKLPSVDRLIDTVKEVDAIVQTIRKQAHSRDGSARLSMLAGKASLYRKHALARLKRLESSTTAKADKTAPVTSEGSPPLPSGLSFLTIAGSKPGADLTAKANAGLEATGIIDLGGSGDAKYQWSRKGTAYRLQHHLPIESIDRGRLVVFTQDTQIVYVQVSAVGSAQGRATVVKDFGTRADGKKVLATGERKYSTSNSLTYTSCQIAWTPESILPPTGKMNTASAVTFPTSGVCLGQSVSHADLMAIIEGSADGNKAALAKSLGVRPEQLDAALAHMRWMADSEFPSGAVVFEAAFAAPAMEDLTIRWEKGVPALTDDSLKALVTKMKESPNLQRISARYRKADSYAEGLTAGFKLGVGQTGIGIDLKSIREASVAGMVELTDVWFGDFAAFNDVSAAGYQGDWREGAVPPTVLITQ